MASIMTKFWTICVAGKNNTVTERYYTLEEAMEAAENKAKTNPSEIYLILELVAYTEGESSVSVNTEIVE